MSGDVAEPRGQGALVEYPMLMQTIEEPTSTSVVPACWNLLPAQSNSGTNPPSKTNSGRALQGDRPLFRCRKIAVDAVADARRGGLDGVAREMGIAGGRLNLRVAQQLADHRQSLAERQRT